MRETKLKPCPFCGGEAKVIRIENYHTNSYSFFATCLVCGAEMPRISRTTQQAREAWNRRIENDR